LVGGAGSKQGIIQGCGRITGIHVIDCINVTLAWKRLAIDFMEGSKARHRPEKSTGNSMCLNAGILYSHFHKRRRLRIGKAPNQRVRKAKIIGK
jgi:hypothetical protein